MNLIEELIDVVYNILRIVVIVTVASIILFFGYKTIYHVASANKPLVMVEKTTDNRPTYEYLKSVTVYIVHKMGTHEDGKMKAAIGTGTVVKELDNNFYILTNKHVCSNETEDYKKYNQDPDNCYVSLTGDPRLAFVKLTYVRSAKEGIDLELWKVDSALLPNKQIVKGFNVAKIQDRVYSVGHYLAVPFIYSEGTFAGNEFESELYNLPSASGCSGSGIFNSDGEIVSILFAGNVIPPFQTDTAKAIGVPGKDVKEFVEQ